MEFNSSINKNKLVNLLCDPTTKANVHIEGDVVLSDTGEKYPYVKNIPIFLKDEESVSKSIEILVSDKSKTGFSWAASHWYDLNIKDLLGANKNEINFLLSFGSGSPVEKKNMQDMGYEVVSLDINAKYKGVDVIGDGHELPFKDNTFGTVTAFEVLEHLHSPWIAILEINRVLKPGGRFVGSVAFLKEFHSSYYHMSHWGVKHLLEYGGFEIETLYGGQNIFSRLVHNILPLGPTKFSKMIYDYFSTGIMYFRKQFWATKNRKDFNKASKVWDDHPFSFAEYDKIRFAPTVLFSAKKKSNPK